MPGENKKNAIIHNRILAGKLRNKERRLKAKRKTPYVHYYIIYMTGVTVELDFYLSFTRVPNFRDNLS